MSGCGRRAGRQRDGWTNERAPHRQRVRGYVLVAGLVSVRRCRVLPEDHDPPGAAEDRAATLAGGPGKRDLATEAFGAVVAGVLVGVGILTVRRVFEDTEGHVIAFPDETQRGRSVSRQVFSCAISSDHGAVDAYLDLTDDAVRVVGNVHLVLVLACVVVAGAGVTFGAVHPGSRFDDLVVGGFQVKFLPAELASSHLGSSS